MVAKKTGGKEMPTLSNTRKVVFTICSSLQLKATFVCPYEMNSEGTAIMRCFNCKIDKHCEPSRKARRTNLKLKRKDYGINNQTAKGKKDGNQISYYSLI